MTIEEHLDWKGCHGIEIRAGGPFGAVIARAGEGVADGWNRVTPQNDPTAQAEAVAIREAAQSLGTHDLSLSLIHTPEPTRPERTS